MGAYTPPPAGVAAPAAHATTHISGGGDAFTNAQLLEAIVKRLQESGGPTTLTLGAVADGDVLTRSGASVLGTTLAALAASLNVDIKTLSVQDSASAGVLTYTLPANELGADGDSLLILASWIRVTAGATARITFGGTLLLGGLDSNASAFAAVLLTRLGASSQRSAGFMVASSTAGPAAHRTTSAINLAANADVVAEWSAANADRDATLLAVFKLKAA